MLNVSLTKRFHAVILTCQSMVSRVVDQTDLTGVMDFAAIFATNLKQYTEFTRELANNGQFAELNPTGDYYFLYVPLETSVGVVKRCRISRPSPDHQGMGYLDFEVKDFNQFKRKYLKKSGFTLMRTHANIEIVEFIDPSHQVRAYFPNRGFS